MHQIGSHRYLLPSSSPLATLETLDRVRQKIGYSRRLEHLWVFIEESYSDPDIRLTDAAQRSGVSQDHLNILLRRFANTTFHDLLSRYRIEKCLELLYERNYTLTEIYNRCGFNSPTTFDRQFKRWVVACRANINRCNEQSRFLNKVPRFLNKQSRFLNRLIG